MIRDDGIKAVPTGAPSLAPGETGPSGPLATSKALDDLAASLCSPNLKTVVAHWVQAKGAQIMPSWEQLSPARIAPQLPLVWAYRYDWELDRFTGRLAGEKIRQIFGKNIRGLCLDEIFPPDAVDWTYRLYRRVVQEPALYRSMGRIFSHMRRGGVGERVILPLSGDGVLGDGILGITDYRYPDPSTASEVETEQWFCLRPQRLRRDPH